MQILFFATIRGCTGEKETRWNEPAATLGVLLRSLSGRYGPAFRRWVLDNGDLGKAILVVVNGTDSRHLGGINTPLHPDDTIAIFPMIAGGQGLTC